MQGSPQPNPEVIKILGQALVDDDFRNDLFADPDSATKDYSLTDHDRQRLKKVARQPDAFDELRRTFHDYLVAHTFIQK